MFFFCQFPATALILQPIQIANTTDPQMLKLNAVAVKKSFVETCPGLVSPAIEEEDPIFESGLLRMTYGHRKDWIYHNYICLSA
jgi:hypothetical protein